MSCTHAYNLIWALFIIYAILLYQSCIVNFKISSMYSELKIEQCKKFGFIPYLLHEVLWQSIYSYILIFDIDAALCVLLLRHPLL